MTNLFRLLFPHPRPTKDYELSFSSDKINWEVVSEPGSPLDKPRDGNCSSVQLHSTAYNDRIVARDGVLHPEDGFNKYKLLHNIRSVK